MRMQYLQVAGNKTESPTAQTEEEFHWERVQTPLPDGESTIWAQAEAHGTVIAGTHKQLFALENGSWNELPCRMISCTETPLCEDADGGFWFLYTTMNNSSRLRGMAQTLPCRKRF